MKFIVSVGLSPLGGQVLGIVITPVGFNGPNGVPYRVP